jgi:hypothetical protein
MSQEEKEKLRDAGSYQEFPLETSDRFKAASESFKEGCLILHEDTFPGYDSYFLIQTTKPVKDEEAVATTGNFTKVKNALSTTKLTGSNLTCKDAVTWNCTTYTFRACNKVRFCTHATSLRWFTNRYGRWNNRF